MLLHLQCRIFTCNRIILQCGVSTFSSSATGQRERDHTRSIDEKKTTQIVYRYNVQADRTRPRSQWVSRETERGGQVSLVSLTSVHHSAGSLPERREKHEADIPLTRVYEQPVGLLPPTGEVCARSHVLKTSVLQHSQIIYLNRGFVCILVQHSGRNMCWTPSK